MSNKRVSKTTSPRKKKKPTQTITRKSEKLPKIDISDWHSKILPMVDASLKKYLDEKLIESIKFYTRFERRKQTRTLEDRIEVRISLMDYGNELSESSLETFITSFAILEKRGEPLDYIIKTATIDDQSYESWLRESKNMKRSEEDREMMLRIYKQQWKDRKNWMKKHKKQYDIYKLILKHLKMKDLSYFYKG